MRNLIVCCDGTWNTPDQEHDGVPTPSNVTRLFNCLAPRDPAGNEQLKYYHPGVGSEGNWWERVAGGSVGIGLTHNILSAYKWLGVNYRTGDRIFLFGFSRGAYTARSLGGMITTCGLLDLTAVPAEQVWGRVEKACEQGYRKKKPVSSWGKGLSFHLTGGTGGNAEVFFIGVWETVGALGIPNDMGLLNLLDNSSKYEFHDTSLSERVRHARHAVALDEQRASFAPTLWTNLDKHPSVRQVWFPGVHCDLGGGYLEKGLSDGALKWMIDEASVKDIGLAFHSGMVAQIAPSAQDVLHDSCTGVFRILPTQPRSLPRLDQANAAILHKSVFERMDTPPLAQAPYRPMTPLPKGGKVTLEIYASQVWNHTGVYLEAGRTYTFSAEGEWKDSSIPCGPAGTNDGNFNAGELVHIASSAWGKMEKFFKRLSHNDELNLKGTRREEDLPWFSLVGVIANGGEPGKDGSPARGEVFLIGDSATFTPMRSGYLYCFANDVLSLYGNNRGSVTLRVE